MSSAANAATSVNAQTIVEGKKNGGRKDKFFSQTKRAHFNNNQKSKPVNSTEKDSNKIERNAEAKRKVLTKQERKLIFFKTGKELEHFEKGLNNALTSENKGYKLLQKMGYQTGQPLGKRVCGIVEPLAFTAPFSTIHSRAGLGQHANVPHIIGPTDLKSYYDYPVYENQIDKKYCLEQYDETAALDYVYDPNYDPSVVEHTQKFYQNYDMNKNHDHQAEYYNNAFKTVNSYSTYVESNVYQYEDQMSPNQGSVSSVEAPSSYLSAIKEKSFFVEILSTDLPWSQMNEDQYNMLKNSLTTALLTARPVPSFHYTEFYNGIFRTLCVNEYTLNWLTKTIPNLPNLWDGAKFHISPILDTNRKSLLTFRIDEDIEITDVLNRIKLQNPHLNVQEWSLKNCGRTKMGEITINMLIDSETVASIKAMDNGFYFGLNKINAYIKF